MRTRLTVLVVAILLVAAFAALNWSEFVRPTELLFGPIVAAAPLGLIMLALLAITLIAFIISDSVTSTRSLMETRHYHKTLEAQRELADKAEASRFTDLRTHLDAQLKELRQRDSIAASEFEKSVVQGQRELRTQLEQINRTLAARLTELEHRLDARFDRAGLQPAAAALPSAARPTMPHSEVARHEPPVADRMAHEARLRDERAHEQRRQEERMREERMRAEDRAPMEDRRVGPEEKAGPTGWRRWF